MDTWSPAEGAVCRGCRPFRCSLHGGRTLLGAGLEGHKPHPLPVTFSASYVWREMWPLSFLFLLPYFPAMMAFYTPAEINAFTKLLSLLVSGFLQAALSSFPCLLLSTIQAFPSGNVSFGEFIVLKPWGETVPLWHPQPFILLTLTCVSPCSLTEVTFYYPLTGTKSPQPWVI